MAAALGKAHMAWGAEPTEAHGLVRPGDFEGWASISHLGLWMGFNQGPHGVRAGPTEPQWPTNGRWQAWRLDWRAELPELMGLN